VDHVWPRSTVDRGGAAKSAVARPPKHGAQALRLAGGGRGGRGGAITGDGAAVKRSGNSGKAVAMKARDGGELHCERGGKEGGVGCGEVRRGRGACYRCRGGGRQPDGATLVVVEWRHHSGHFGLE
jgi:hypothetical protein